MKLQCEWCKKQIENGEFEIRSWFYEIDPRRNGGQEEKVHPECAKKIDALKQKGQEKFELARKKREEEQQAERRTMRQAYDRYPAMEVLTDENRFSLPRVMTLEERCQRKPSVKELRQTQKTLKRSGFEPNISFGDYWDGSPEIEYAKHQSDALLQHQKQLQKLKTITYAEQVQVHFLKMSHDQQVLFIRALTSDPGGKIAKLFELERKLPSKKQLQGVTPKRLTVGKEKKDN